MKVGLVVNPIAGMGGRVGLKGTDGRLKHAIELGAEPVAEKKVREFLKDLKVEVEFIAAPGEMGAKYLKQCTVVARDKFEYRKSGIPKTTKSHTKKYLRLILKKNPNLILFVGGDGTARDVYSVVKEKVPVLGIPAGVKVFSSVFASSPGGAAVIVEQFSQGKLETKKCEVMDINEEAFRRNRLEAKLIGYALVPHLPAMIPGAKMETEVSEEEEQEIIARRVVSMMDEGLYLLGPGTTVERVAKKLKIDKTLLGIDIVHVSKEIKLIKKDANESDILHAVEKYGRPKVVVSPIGRQGFILGRGNQQISERVLEGVEKGDIIVVATQGKLDELSGLRVDVNAEINERLKGEIMVFTSYTDRKIEKVV